MDSDLNVTLKVPNIKLKIFLDVLCALIIFVPTVILDYFIEPYKRGIFCDDESIRYPYRESTISTGLAVSLAIIIPITCICCTEYFKLRKSFNYLRPLLWIIYNHIICYSFGACTSKLLTDISKYSIGRHRPHFIDVCKPNVCEYLISDGIYYENFECKGNPDLIKDAKLSFMSGHSSCMAFSMVYTAIYLHKSITYTEIRLTIPFVNVLLINLALFTGFTRISDYKHHWSDVLIGLLNGTTVAILTYIFVTQKILENAFKYINPALKRETSRRNSFNVELSSTNP